MTRPSHPSPRKTVLAAAALVAAALGAASGQAIGDTPILRADAKSALPSSGTGSMDYGQQAETELPPDHYPLVTPDGTIPVAELALYGRMRDHQDSWFATEEPLLLEARYQDELREDEIDRLARAPASPMDASRAASPQIGTLEPELERDATSEPATGDLRILDVLDALAAEDRL
ncbi:MAG: hypothetical protein R3E14_04725 [Erythrobacter sp.]